MRPRNADDLTPDELASAAIDMDLVLEREPQLSDIGFKQLRGRRPLAEQNAQFLKCARTCVRRGRWRSSGGARLAQAVQQDQDDQPVRNQLRPEALRGGRHWLCDQRLFHRCRDCRELHCPLR
jgi:hypothetical protein